MLFQPVVGLANDILFVVQFQFANQHGGSEEHEIGIQNIAAAVVVDLVNLPLVKQFLHHVSGDLHFPGLAEYVCDQV